MERDKLLHILTSLKKFSLKGLVVVTFSSIVCFMFFKNILNLLLKTVNIKVYYFAFPEVFFSSVELAIYTGVFFSLPVLIVLMWHEFKGFIKLKASEGWLFVIFSIVLFYTGSLFCYFIVLQSGVTFLLGYEGGALKAMISVEKFIKFSL
ncbi:MAG: twin-arginine translocase subunit TatC [Deltaproteobacteria bacterium]